MCITKNVTCCVDHLGVLVPNVTGTFLVTLTKTPGINGEPATGTVIWNNKVQAFLTFDIESRRVVGFSITDMSMAANITQLSVENLIKLI